MRTTVLIKFVASTGLIILVLIASRITSDQKLVGKLDPVVAQMNDDLTRMVLNPDVTVRSRCDGKMFFLCSAFAGSKTESKKSRTALLADGECKNCLSAGLSDDAIVFGNVHDKESQVSQNTRAENA